MKKHPIPVFSLNKYRNNLYGIWTYLGRKRTSTDMIPGLIVLSYAPMEVEPTRDSATELLIIRMPFCDFVEDSKEIEILSTFTGIIFKIDKNLMSWYFPITFVEANTIGKLTLEVLSDPEYKRFKNSVTIEL